MSNDQTRKDAPLQETEGPKHQAVSIAQLPTGVKGLDDILGGGLPEFSLNLIAGTPGSGKSTLAQQIAFANGTRERPAVYFSMVGEPLIKLLRYQQQFSFFDQSKVGVTVRFVNLSDVLSESDLDVVLAKIFEQATSANAGLIVLDSFRILARQHVGETAHEKVQSFLYRLGQFFVSLGCTALLIGEYGKDEIRDEPVFAMVDGIIWLSQVTDRNSVVRKLDVVKLRGQATIPGVHTMRISSDGLQTFARTLGVDRIIATPFERRRLAFGVDELDKMLGGGVFSGDSILIAGPSGTGKSAMASQFIAEGLNCGESGVMVIFEERPNSYIDRADAFGLKLRTAQNDGRLEILYLRPLDLSVDEAMQEIVDAIKRTGAKRLVIDSLVGFETALAPGFRSEFRESFYRMITVLTGAGITILSTVEIEDTFTAFQFSPYAVSFLTDDIIRLRYVEIDGQMRKIMVIIKMRGSNHSKDIREYVITDSGVVIVGPRHTEYEQMSTGIPHRTGPRQAQADELSPEPKSAT
ncbi:AAA family ATPase [Sphingosinicellaceae bacterium]|nr:AAA family ATPase [Sphingosinicellaceae bacterium]